jgi:hypothetical protein
MTDATITDMQLMLTTAHIQHIFGGFPPKRDFQRCAILVRPEVKRVWQKMMVRIADRQWRKRDWGKAV